MTDVGERVLDPEAESGTETEAATHMFDMGALGGRAVPDRDRLRTSRRSSGRPAAGKPAERCHVRRMRTGNRGRSAATPSHS